MTEQVETIQAEIAPVVAQARAVAVETASDYTTAGVFLTALKTAQKKVAAYWDPVVAQAYAAHKGLTAKKAEMMKPLTDAESTVKRAMSDYSIDQARIQAAETARLQAEENARAERERAAAMKAAEKLKTPELREARLEAAAAIAPAAVYVAPTVPKVEGQSTRTVYRAVVTDPKALALALLSWPDWMEYIEVKQGALDRLAQRTRGQIAGVPGLTIQQDIGITTRTK